MRIHDLLAKHHKERVADLHLKRQENPHVADVLEENICRIVELRKQAELSKSVQDRIADVFTLFSGSMAFVYLHVLWFGIWIPINLGWTPIKAFDPFPFGLLTMIVSLEAIFLSTFVLISQNKMGEVADKRADLDLQINLLSEYEITRILRLIDAMAEQMNIDEAFDPAIDELKETVAPDMVLEEIERRSKQAKER